MNDLEELLIRRALTMFGLDEPGVTAERVVSERMTHLVDSLELIEFAVDLEELLGVELLEDEVSDDLADQPLRALALAILDAVDEDGLALLAADTAAKASAEAGRPA